MATFNKFNTFVEDLLKGVHKFDTHTIKVYLTNATPSATDDAVKADLLEITVEHGYTGAAAATVTVTESGGVAQVNVTADPAAWTATGGSFGPFRYVVCYNDSATSDPLIGWWDYGDSINIGSGETFTVNLAATLLTLT